ncbi:mitochondrial fission protein ELM1-like [Bidens hawaiensis]|uniref:mitochondrial fission protein ELM1-like n=1 Tax=Bidens hawaiensis TaxID=980011 RepID=UPI004049294D
MEICSSCVLLAKCMQRVRRPRGGINEYLLWLPVSLHKQIYYIIRLIYGYSQVLITSKGSRVQSLTGENGGSVGLSSVLEADVKSIVKMAKGTAEKDGPLLVVACGRDTISIASSIKKLAAENVFVVQIQHPRTQLNRFDLVVAPQHDYYALTAHAQEQVPRLFRKYITPNEPPSKNVVLTVGALHQVDFAALRSAAITWHDEFAPLPKPLIVVNIGGPTSHCKYGIDLSKQLTNYVRGVLDSCGSVRISFSRRTPAKVANFVRKELGDDPKIYIYDGEEPNPHMGHLAWADAFIVTADSVSMLSEACSTGKPVYVVGAERCKWKIGEFHKTLRERGLVRPFTGLEDMSESWSYPPLNDTADVANRVHEALADRGWRLRP